MKKEKNIFENLGSRGITLIALVVTIVVLLILAGITITMVLGEDGILSQAKLAAQKTKEAEEQQEKDLQDLVGMVNEAVNGKDPDKLEDAVSSGKVFSNTTGYDSAGNKIDKNSEEKEVAAITIPAGFKITDGDLNSIDQGVVISDEAGNEFVWVPCAAEEYKEHDYSTRTGEDDAETNGEDINDGGWNTYHYTKYNDWTGDEDQENKNKESVAKYGGFYIARYEAGIPSTAPFYVDSKSKVKTYAVAEQKNTSNYAPVSKKGAQAWNYIDQTNAKKVAERMYSGNRYVTSQLVDGIAWDRTVDWIATNNADIEKDSTSKGNYADNYAITVDNTQYAEHVIQYEITSDEKNVDKGWKSIKEYKFGIFKSGWNPFWGKSEEENPALFNVLEETDKTYNYTHYVEMATGASEQTKLNNIYDLAGNMYEWTTETGYHKTEANLEAGSEQYAVRRGGSFIDYGKTLPVSFRGGDMAGSFTGPSFGFRVVLYVK